MIQNLDPLCNFFSKYVRVINEIQLLGCNFRQTVILESYCYSLSSALHQVEEIKAVSIKEPVHRPPLKSSLKSAGEERNREQLFSEGIFPAVKGEEKGVAQGTEKLFINYVLFIPF